MTDREGSREQLDDWDLDDMGHVISREAAERARLEAMRNWYLTNGIDPDDDVEILDAGVPCA